MSDSVQRSMLRYKLICNGCNYRFATEYDLRTHTCPRPEERASGFKCSICKAVFDFVEPLKKHMRICSAKNSHTCKFCGDSFSSAQLLQEHEASNHNKKNIYECRYCQFPFYSESNLFIHERVHEKEPVACGLCKKRFSSFDSLKGHVEQNHKRSLSNDLIKILLQCKSCYEYYDKGEVHECRGLNRKPVVGTSVAPFKCEKCFSKFTRLSQLNRHLTSCLNPLKRKQEEPLSPSSAYLPSNKTTKTEDQEKQEETSSLGNERPYACEICSSRFKYDFSLSAHMVSHQTQELKAMDEFAEIVRRHEDEGSVAQLNMIQLIDSEVFSLPPKSGHSSQISKTSKPSGLLNLLQEHLDKEELVSMGILSTQNNYSTSTSSCSPLREKGDGGVAEDECVFFKDEKSK